MDLTVTGIAVHCRLGGNTESLGNRRGECCYMSNDGWLIGCAVMRSRREYRTCGFTAENIEAPHGNSDTQHGHGEKKLF